MQSMSGNQGIVYVMTASIAGLVKIGRTQNFKDRMKELASHGRNNIGGLEPFFAIEVSDYSAKEALLHKVFGKQRISSSEFFAIDDLEMIRSLLLSFDGRVVYQKDLAAGKPEAAQSDRKKPMPRFNFEKIGIKPGEQISFLHDSDIKATVRDSRRVEFEGKLYKVSPLAVKLLRERGVKVAYSVDGPNYWTYDGESLRTRWNAVSAQ